MTEVAVPPVAAVPPPAPPGWLVRWSDRINPILVREVQQAVKGRAFALTILVALLFTVGLSIGIASDGHISERDGRDAFSWGLMLLTPLVLFVVPMQAFQSTRMELRAGIVEQLLLSRLRPHRIVAGKIGAAMVQYFLYLSLLAPYLTTTYLLRGVDLASIAVCLSLSLLFCLAVTALAISAAAQAILPQMQAIVSIAIAFSLGLLTIVVMAAIGSGDMLRELGQAMRSPEWSMMLSALVLGSLVATVLGAMVGATLLSHAFENRSTPFRLLLLAVGALAYAWMITFVPRAHWEETSMALTSMLLACGAVLGLFLISEQERLSPRQVALCSRRPRLSMLCLLLLPGRSRGLLFMLAWFGLLLLVCASFMSGGSWQPDMWRAFTYVVAYAVIYLSMIKALRGRLPETANFNHATRFLFPFLLALCCGVPALFDALLAGGVRGWHVGHALNPFYTMMKFVDRRGAGADDVALGLALFAGALLLLQVRSLVGGVREVLAVGGARKGAAGDGS